MKILLVEDDAVTRRLLETVLGARGHQVTACTDAESGMRTSATIMPWWCSIGCSPGWTACSSATRSARGGSSVAPAARADDGLAAVPERPRCGFVAGLPRPCDRTVPRFRCRGRWRSKKSRAATASTRLREVFISRAHASISWNSSSGKEMAAFMVQVLPVIPGRGQAARRGEKGHGRAFSEPTLIRLAYGFEQATHARRVPLFLPHLVSGASARNGCNHRRTDARAHRDCRLCRRPASFKRP
jgi:hypothetical protein